MISVYESRIIELHIRAVQKAPQIGPFWVLGAPIPESSCVAEISKKLNETDYLLLKSAEQLRVMRKSVCESILCFMKKVVFYGKSCNRSISLGN